jgi:serine/threonine-protein kinase ATR
MRSLAKPRKVSLMGSNGRKYIFLGKPKDDLRKDARLMDFNGIINKLLKSTSDSRRRRLRACAGRFLPVVMLTLDLDIRTYGVVTLNEECGFVQWVPNTKPIRGLLNDYYSARGIPAWVRSPAPSYFPYLTHATAPRYDATF